MTTDDADDVDGGLLPARASAGDEAGVQLPGGNASVEVEGGVRGAEFPSPGSGKNDGAALEVGDAPEKDAVAHPSASPKPPPLTALQPALRASPETLPASSTAIPEPSTAPTAVTVTLSSKYVGQPAGGDASGRASVGLDEERPSAARWVTSTAPNTRKGPRAPSSDDGYRSPATADASPGVAGFADSGISVGMVGVLLIAAGSVAIASAALMYACMVQSRGPTHRSSSDPAAELQHHTRRLHVRLQKHASRS